MKKLILLLFIVVSIASCIKTKQALFILQNNTTTTITAVSCASNGKNTSCFTDNINMNTSATLREKTKSDAENVPVSDMFESITITKNGISCKKNWQDNSNWVKSIGTDKVTYTISVSDTDF